MMFRSAASLLLLASPLGVAADKGMAAKTVLLRGKAMLDQQNPIPPTVLECLMNPDETSCNSATDEDGKPCDWCNTLVGIGACMSEEAAELAKEFQPLFMCDGDANEIMSGVEPDVQECLENTDSDSCDQDSACDWCTTPFNADLGACLTNDLADKAKQFQPLVTCDGSSNMRPEVLRWSLSTSSNISILRYIRKENGRSNPLPRPTPLSLEDTLDQPSAYPCSWRK